MPVSLSVAIGGAIGAVSRYGIDRIIERRSTSLFPWSTFTINATGCLAIGVAIAALVDRHHLPGWLRIGVAVGVLGGYTTFSTFAQETLGLIEEGRTATAATYGIASVGIGIAAVYLGTEIGHRL